MLNRLVCLIHDLPLESSLLTVGHSRSTVGSGPTVDTVGPTVIDCESTVTPMANIANKAC